MSVVEMLDKIANGESDTILPIIKKDFEEHQVQQFVKTKVMEITTEGVKAVNTEIEQQVLQRQ